MTLIKLLEVTASLYRLLLANGVSSQLETVKSGVFTPTGGRMV